MISIEELEKYAKEVKRKHLYKKGYRIFKHPSFDSAYIVVKGTQVLGMTNSKILRDNSETYWMLKHKNFIPLAL